MGTSGWADTAEQFADWVRTEMLDTSASCAVEVENETTVTAELSDYYDDDAAERWARVEAEVESHGWFITEDGGYSVGNDPATVWFHRIAGIPVPVPRYVYHTTPAQYFHVLRRQMRRPYRAPLVRWGQGLHDRFLLPYWIWRDFEDVLAELARRGVEPAWVQGELRATGCATWERATPRVTAGRVVLLVVADRRPRWRVEIYSPDDAIYEVECASGYLPAGAGVAAAQRRAVLAAADLLRKHRSAA